MSAEANGQLGPGAAGDASVESRPPLGRKATPRRNLLVFSGGTLLAVAGGLILF